MKIKKTMLRRILRESLLTEITSHERETGLPSEFVEANWEHWLDARGLLTSDLDDLAHYVGAPDQSWLPAAPPANGMIGPADLELWAEKRAVDIMYDKRSKDSDNDGYEPGQGYAGIS